MFSGCLKTRDFANESYSKNIDTLKNNSEEITICEWPIERQLNWKEWTLYLQKSLALDSASLDSIPAGTYSVLVQLVIEGKGKIKVISVLKDPGYGLGQRVENAILHYNNRLEFIEEENVYPIKIYRKQPIIFVVN